MLILANANFILIFNTSVDIERGRGKIKYLKYKCIIIKKQLSETLVEILDFLCTKPPAHPWNKVSEYAHVITNVKKWKLIRFLESNN